MVSLTRESRIEVVVIKCPNPILRASLFLFDDDDEKLTLLPVAVILVSSS